MANEFKLSYTASDINERLGKIDSLANKSEIPSKLSELTNDSGFATESYVDSAVANIDIPEVDLSGYALKSEIPTNYLTDIPTEYITESELNAKGYLTQHQSLEGLATEQYVTEGLAAKQPVGDYALKSEIPTQVQADWNVDDPDNAAYVKNRTHYSYIGDVELLNSYTASVTGLAEYYFGWILDAADRIICTVDGVEHTFNRVEDLEDMCVYWGRDEFEAGDSPVYFSSNFTLDYGEIVAVEDGNTYDISFDTYKIEVCYQPLDERFIPDSIARTADVTAIKSELILCSSTQDSFKLFKITVDDTGTLTVSEVQ